MNRLLTTLVQLALLVPAVIGVRAMWEWLKEDVRELTRQTRRVDLTNRQLRPQWCGVGRVVTDVIKNTLDPVDNFGRVVACRPQV